LIVVVLTPSTTGTGSIGPFARSVSSQSRTTISSFLHRMRRATTVSSLNFSTHIKPAHCLPFGLRGQSIKVSECVTRSERAAVLDDPGDTKSQATQARWLEREVAVLVEPVPRIQVSFMP
jgi:hypothetical protein